MFTKEIQTFMMDYGYVWPHKFTDELKTLKFDEELAQKVCEVINPLQLRPMCKTKACKNRAKRHNSDKNDVINKYCGVHYRSVIGVEISESEGEMELESDEEFKAEDKVPKSKNKKEVSEVKSQIIKTKKSPKATAKSSPKTGKNTTKTSISPLKREFRSDTKQSITRSKSKK